MTSRNHLDPMIAALDDEPLSGEEWARLSAIPLTQEEIDETLALVECFTRRYPTMKERLDYARRKYLEVTRRPIAIRRP